MSRNAFEDFPLLTTHIARMGNTGKTGTLFEWNNFLKELNKVCEQASEKETHK